MNIDKLKQDLLHCQEVIGDIHIKYYDQDRYREIVTLIFKDIFKDFLNWKTVQLTEQQKRQIEKNCPEKLEPGDIKDGEYEI